MGRILCIQEQSKVPVQNNQEGCLLKIQILGSIRGNFTLLGVKNDSF